MVLNKLVFSIKIIKFPKKYILIFLLHMTKFLKNKIQKKAIYMYVERERERASLKNTKIQEK